jgi:hypothetical protein
MAPISKKDILLKVASLLTEWLKASENEVRVSENLLDEKIDGNISVGNYDFNIEIKGSSSSGQIFSAIQCLEKFNSQFQESTIPLVVVPFMGEVGRNLCKESDVSWVDLSGNADISAPNLRLLIEGRPNQFKGPGRPSSLFAPKSSRIARWLLIHADKSVNQRELAQKTNMDEGFTSRIIARLVEEGLVARKKGGSVQVSDPDLLLDSWREVYDFKKHHILKGHIAERSSNEILKKLSNVFLNNEIVHASTGLSAAWLYTRYAGFRIVSIYLKSLPSADLIKTLGFREEARGSNVWIVIPKDEGVFQGAKQVQDISCVHPVQVYLDLFGHPERAKEAAENIRHELLKWNKNE